MKLYFKTEQRYGTSFFKVDFEKNVMIELSKNGVEIHDNYTDTFEMIESMPNYIRGEEEVIKISKEEYEDELKEINKKING